MATEAKQDVRMEEGMAEKKEPAGIEIDSGAAKRARRSAEGIGASVLEKLAAQIGAHAGARAVFGDPIARDGHTVVPVAQTMWGTGAGTGESDEEGSGSGGGGGAMTRPIGYIDITDEGATYVPISKPWQDWRLVLTWAVAIWLGSRALNRILRG
jgi:Sporulation protein YtfJ (Spore_YtfJ)